MFTSLQQAEHLSDCDGKLHGSKSELVTLKEHLHMTYVNSSMIHSGIKQSIKISLSHSLHVCSERETYMQKRTYSR